MDNFRMVKYLLFSILFCISGAQISCSNGFASDVERFVGFHGIGNNEECIIYEFGFSKIISIYIVKDDAHFDVYISDGNKVNLYTSCEMSPILNWAFEKAPNEIAAIQNVENKDYKPLYYKLTIMVDSVPIVINSSAMRIIGNKAFVEKVDELKRFIISLWMNYLDAQNDGKIAQHACRVGKSS